MRRSTFLSALLALVMISSSCGGSESTNETSAPQEDQSQESETPETSEESSVADEETPAPETADEDPGGPLATAESPLATAELGQSIQAALDDWIAANGAPGSSLAVLLPDGSEVLVASGVQDLRADGAASTEDYWRIASISKPITSAVVLRLVEQGLVDVCLLYTSDAADD